MSNTFPDGFVIVLDSETLENKDASTVHKHTWKFDFTGCTLEQVATKACDSLRISMQGKVRRDLGTNSGVNYPDGLIKVNVAEMLRGVVSVPMTPARFKAELEAATPEQRDAILAEARALLDAVGDSEDDPS